ncbi:hypothetical protein [Prevotella melaninogenica]|uniref:hypothetical protein n=1 Tax=Prevotella melaninogenica TaxID=28132 RepID=UPI003C72A0F4
MRKPCRWIGIVVQGLYFVGFEQHQFTYRPPDSINQHQDNFTICRQQFTAVC